MKLVIATSNKGKLDEFRGALAKLDLQLVGLTSFGKLEEPVEDGETFEANARIKASSYALQTGEWALADDSGLEISALGGKPGVWSARFGGEGSTQPEKNALLLQMLEGAEDRSARFVCAIAVARPDGSIAATSIGVCAGRIARDLSGSNGFGYDPIFVPEGDTRTFAEMSDGDKRSISHRGRATDEIIRQMLDFIGV